MLPGRASRARKRAPTWPLRRPVLLRGRLARKQTSIVLCTAFAAGAALSSVQIYLDSRGVREELVLTGQSYSRLVEETASEAAYRLDDTLARQIIESLVQSPDIDSAAITDDFGDTLAGMNVRKAETMDPFANILLGTEGVVSTVPLTHPGKPEGTVGTLTITLNPAHLGTHFTDRALAILVGGIGKGLLIGIALLVAFHLLVTKRIFTVGKRLSRHGRSGGSLPPAGRSRENFDELDQLEAIALRALDRASTSSQLAKLATQALDAAYSGIIITDARKNNEIIFANRAFEKITGYDRTAIHGMNCRFLNEGLSAQPELAEVNAAIAEGRACQVTVRNRRADGSLFWNRLSISPVRNRDGEISYFIGIQQDVSGEMHEVDLLRNTIKNLNVGCVAIDTAGLIRLFNPSAEAIFGYRESEVLGRNVKMLMPSPDRERHDSYIRNYLETGEAKVIGIGREVEGLRQDGSVFPMHLGISSTESSQGITFLASVTDLTEQKSLQRQLMHSQRLEAVGKLTGGIAHDFNNLMGTIIGSAELLRDHVGSDPDAKATIDRIVKSVEHGATLTSRMLSFSRQLPMEPRPTDVVELLDDMGRMLKTTVGGAITIEITYGEHPWRARVDPAQLESAILNLCLNARDAMPSGGTITIRTENLHHDRPIEIRGETLSAGDYVSVSVRDTGTGIPDDILEKIFEPFFTTKDVGKGSGLGLSMIYGFARQSNGALIVTSEVGVGTVAELVLPRANAGQEASMPRPDEARPAGKNSARILVVEDNHDIRQIAVRLLDSEGHRVEEAADGKEAIELLRTRGPFDLLFTDIVMPGGINGWALFKTALQIQPGIRVLFTSGYNEPDSVPGAADGGDVPLVKKPYRKETLLQAVQAQLAS